MYLCIKLREVERNQIILEIVAEEHNVLKISSFVLHHYFQYSVHCGPYAVNQGHITL